MKQHFKAMVWPRGASGAKVKGKKGEATIYRYVIIGTLITDEPLNELDRHSEVILNGPTGTLVDTLARLKRRKPKFKGGDANSVLLNLNDL